MISLNNWHLENNQEGNIETSEKRITAKLQDGST
jgi:hypothetical protein